jgi:CubicO group peptidase (beta-lactamase class C family)
MRARIPLAAVVLAASVTGCGGAPPTAPGAPATPVTPQTPVDLKTSLSAAFDALPIPTGAGCSTTISQHGQVLLERGRGQVAPGRAPDGNSLYRIGSLTKPITAAALLLSEKTGRVHRNDKISKYRNYPEPSPTIDELIRHAPGLSDYKDHVGAPAWKTAPTTVDILLSLVPPWDGVTRYQYSNSHPIYTAAILEQVNGLRYEEIVQRDIFGPLGMSRTSLTIPPASESTGYPFPSETHPSWVFAAGGIASTSADMTRFLHALLNNQFGFGDVASFDRSAGITSFGMFSLVVGGDLRFTHAGAIDSYLGFNAIFPADRSSVVVLCNFPSPGLPNFGGAVRTIMLGAK